MDEVSDNSNINISDVIEVIETDPVFGSDSSNMMDRNRRVVAAADGRGPAPCVRIVEQPASKALRFRYICEGRSAGSIPGVSSTPENKTFPTIKVENYQGRAMVLVSCVTKDPPYRPHPHNLVGKDGCKKGICAVEVNTDTMTASFANLGVQCVKKKDIEEALRLREELRVDPFRTGFSHRNQSGAIDLNAVRLCFQVFMEGPRSGEFKRPIVPPVVSDAIYDKKAMSDLVICKLSECAASVAGGKEIILLCEKVAKEDISVRFYEERDGHIVWEGLGDFTPTQVHKQVAIAFRTPRYKTLEVEYPIQVSIQLLRPSDKATSEPLPFQLTPLDAVSSSDVAGLKRKRQKFNSQEMFRHLEESENYIRLQKNIPPQPEVKLEPPVYTSNLSPIPSPGEAYVPSSIAVYSNPPSVYTTGNVHQVYSPMHDGGGQMYAPYSPSSPGMQTQVQQVDVQMNPLGGIEHPLLDPSLHQSLNNRHRLSPQNVLQPINDLSGGSSVSQAPSMGAAGGLNRIGDTISTQNMLQHVQANDLNGSTSVSNNIMSLNQIHSPPRPNMMVMSPQQHIVPTTQPSTAVPHQMLQDNDELNTPTVSATNIDDSQTCGTFNLDSQQRISQLNSGDLACILADMDTGALSQNLSTNLTFD